MNDRNPAAPIGAVQSSSPTPTLGGGLGRRLRTIFASTSASEPSHPLSEESTAEKPDETPPTASDAPASLVVIRNCSTKQVLDELLSELGGTADVSGRYFAPGVQDLEKIKQTAARNELFVKESRIKDVVILDLMVDRTIHPFPAGRHQARWHRHFDHDEN